MVLGPREKIAAIGQGPGRSRGARRERRNDAQVKAVLSSLELQDDNFGQSGPIQPIRPLGREVPTYEPVAWFLGLADEHQTIPIPIKELDTNANSKLRPQHHRDINSNQKQLIHLKLYEFFLVFGIEKSHREKFFDLKCYVYFSFDPLNFRFRYFSF